MQFDAGGFWSVSVLRVAANGARKGQEWRDEQDQDRIRSDGRDALVESNRCVTEQQVRASFSSTFRMMKKEANDGYPHIRFFRLPQGRAWIHSLLEWRVVKVTKD